jgi:RNA polymerase sigma factor FliA
MGGHKLQKTSLGVESERDVLIRQYTNLVKHIAAKISYTTPPNVLKEDLVQTGMVGLIEAIDNANDNLCSTYIYYRVRGEIIDSLRKEDGSLKRVRKMMRAIKAAEHRLNRKPSAKETAFEAGITLNEYYATLNEFYCASPLYYEETQEDDEIGHGLDYLVADELTGDPHKIFTTNKLNRLIAALPERERTAITMQYQDGSTLVEIAKKLGVDMARVCQINQQTINKFKRLL